jgi:acetoin utilization transport system ATP-binding protein
MSTISIQHLSKSYGKFLAVDDVTVEIPTGSVFGLLGPNGAGKTTTFKCLLGLARPSSGSIAYDGNPLTPPLFESIAYVPERSVLYEWMTAGEHLEMQRRAFARYDAARAKQLMDQFNLDPRKRVRAMSKGMRTALAIVMAFSIHPETLVLDEPTSGLDPVNQRAVLNLMIEAAAQGATIVLSSHQIGQVERAADHIAVLQRGRVILSGAVDDLKSDRKIVEGIFPSEEIALDGLRRDKRIERVDQAGRILRLTVSADGTGLSEELSRMGAQSVRIVDLNLEDIFLYAVAPEKQTADIVEAG